MSNMKMTEQTAQTFPYLDIRQIKKNFSKFEALKGVSFSVARGEFLCLVGPSGCGKTTLLRCIAGLETQTSGDIIQNGIDIGKLPVEQRDFGIVFQSYALFPNLSVWGNICYGIQTKGLTRQADMKRLEELLAMVRLSGHRDKYPSQLSGGEQQRVALVRALATSPGLLLLDEPLSALDAQVRHHLRREIKQIQKNLDVTTIMVTHDQEEALSMADRVAVMEEGQIKQIGAPSDIYHKPNSRFIASFIGSMNMFLGCKIALDQLSVKGLTLACAPDESAIGTDVTFAFRPEHVVLSLSDNGAQNAILATVIDRETRGATDRIFLSSPALVGDLCADMWSSNALLSKLTPGTAVTLHVPAHAVVILEVDQQ
ncbi:MAG: ATP-binding cassette domain-containing protein [Paracoccaceae bacterium]